MQRGTRASSKSLPTNKEIEQKKNNANDEQNVQWLDFFDEIMQRLGYTNEGKNLRQKQVVYIIDDFNPRLFICQTIRKQQEHNDNGWVVNVRRQDRKSVSDQYELWYPEWMIFQKKSRAEAVLQELQKRMNMQ
jgi:hypothetical protein